MKLGKILDKIGKFCVVTVLSFFACWNFIVALAMTNILEGATLFLGIIEHLGMFYIATYIIFKTIKSEKKKRIIWKCVKCGREYLYPYDGECENVVCRGVLCEVYKND